MLKLRCSRISGRTGTGTDHLQGPFIMSILSIVGGVVFVLGALIFVGNVTRIFPTIPLAGYLTMLAGGAMYKAGKSQ